MRLTRERKIYLAVAGAALLGLGADRVLFADPREEPTPAITPVVATTTSPAAKSSPQLAVLLAPLDAGEDGLLAERLRRLAREAPADSGRSSRDAFAVPESWVAPTAAPDTTRVGVPGNDFEASHELGGILPNAPVPCAMVDGNLVVVGQRVDGHTLESVRERSVVFVKGETRFELHLDDALLGSTLPDNAVSIATTEVQ